MRRWEYVEGSASKFWETGADGALVTVRYAAWLEARLHLLVRSELRAEG